MTRIAYSTINIGADRLELIRQCNEIIAEYQAEGYMLTLRQLYYQMVSRDIIVNTMKSYKRLGDVVNDARMAGLMDWDAIEDRTRELATVASWNSPADILEACAKQFRLDLWAEQDNYVECFPPETPIRTLDGSLAIGSVVEGDWVISGAGVGRRVARVFRRPYKGTMTQVKAVGLLPFLCTPDHPIWAQEADRSLPGYKGSDRRFLPPAYLPAQGLTKFSLLRVPRLKGIYPQPSVRMLPGSRSYDPGDVAVDDAFLTVLGFYLAEGCVKADGRTVQFTFSSDEPHFADSVRTWAETIGFHPFIRAGSGTCIVYVCSKAFASWLTTNFGSGSRNKHLPSWCLGLPYAQQLTLLKAYVQGDGHWSDPTRSAITVTSFSEALAQDVQTVLLRCGYAAGLTRYTDHGWSAYRVVVGGASGAALAVHWGMVLPPKGLGRSARYNHIRMDEDYAYFPVQGTVSLPYDGEVCNLEVDTDHTYCVPVEVHNCWIEKEALASVFERACKPLGVPHFCCRGYTSQSEMWGAGQRFARKIKAGKKVHVLHFGDHDPSGIDMTRDIEDRIRLFVGHHCSSGSSRFHINRLALNMDQVEKYNPPENPAKMTDSRFASYEALYGNKSWELDALNPRTLNQIVKEHVLALADETLFAETRQLQANARGLLQTLSDNWDEVAEHVETTYSDELEGNKADAHDEPEDDA